MLKSLCIFLCLCYFVVGSYGSGNLVPFIDKCEWSDNACLLASTIKAVPYFCDGLPQLGIEPMDPLRMTKNVTFKEGGMRIDFTNMKVTDLCKCNILKVERDIKKNILKLESECPIDIVGDYHCDGNLLSVPIEGKGPFHVNCKNIFIALEVGVTPEVGKDGLKYWKLGKVTHTFEARKNALIYLENLFNGDKEKAQPVTTLINENSKDMMHTIGKPIVDQVLYEILKKFQVLSTVVPANQLEI